MAEQQQKFPSNTKEFDKKGNFTRQSNLFTTPFGSEAGDLPVAAGKYRLVWAPVCPWAHRAIIVRRLLGLEEAISVGTADPLRPKIDRIDWEFTLDPEGVDPVLGVRYISELYLNADPDYAGRPTVPAIIDIETKRVVQNDYHNLTYYLEREWQPLHKAGAPDLLPADLEADIRALNDIIFNEINNGVYKCGFAKSQAAYEAAYDVFFARMDWLEERLANQRYLFGERLTDADVRLYVTLARFDVAYNTAFKVNRNRLIDFPNLWAYARDLYQTPGFGDTTDFDAIKLHYHASTHADPNEVHSPIVPKGPDTSIWELPHYRG